ncbi:MAG: M1 family metallopeptidase [Flexibacteraceae bacterium]
MRFSLKQFLFSLLLLLIAHKGNTQTIADVEKIPSDSLRGHLYPWRAAIDVLNYTIGLKVNPKNKSIKGSVIITFEVLKPTNLIQWDLDTALRLNSISSPVLELVNSKVQRKNSTIFLEAKSALEEGIYTITLHYSGKPKVSKQPPWDGGFVWKTDSTGAPWIGLAVEGEGASLWFPCKDHLSDKATFSVTCTVPKPLIYVGNGRQIHYDETDSTTTATWSVLDKAPTYSISLNFGRYIHIPDSMMAQKGLLRLDYYVLPESLEKAKNYFSVEVKPMITAFEKRLGAYPFYFDGYALIQTPYWGMEHQSGIAYGNNFVKNEADMDFIIVHESAHEWWGNSLSCSDHANMFIQEGYCTYSEFLYLEETKTPKEVGLWLKHHFNQIRNKQPMRGPEGINYLNSDTDIYYKYALALHTLRQVIGEQKFNSYIKSLYKSGKYKSISYAQFRALNNKYIGKNHTKLLEWYISHTQYPTIQYKNTDKGVYIRWDSTNFERITVPLIVQSKPLKVIPTNNWQKIAPSAPDIEIKLAEPYLLFNLQQIR